jgi:hypothetical protein
VAVSALSVLWRTNTILILGHFWERSLEGDNLGLKRFLPNRMCS